MVTFVLLTYLAGAAPRKMSGWDFPRRQTETGKTPSLLTYYHQVLSSYQSFSIFFKNIGEVRFLVVLGTVGGWSSGKGR